MKGIRLLRLQADYEAIRLLARCHPMIEVEGVSGNPPTRYRLRMKIRSLREQEGAIITVEDHRLEVVLPQTYPRDAPLCRMLTPTFHPNIAPQAVCIGDHWTASESLAAMIQRVGEMLAFQSYNVRSPLNGRAARWVEENGDRLPIDDREIFRDLAEGESDKTATSGLRCANCHSPTGPYQRCGAGHAQCPDCVRRCQSCDHLLCLACDVSECEACAGPPCSNCGSSGAKTEYCQAAHAICSDCSILCEQCGRKLCIVCGDHPCSECSARQGQAAAGSSLI